MEQPAVDIPIVPSQSPGSYLSNVGVDNGIRTSSRQQSWIPEFSWWLVIAGVCFLIFAALLATTLSIIFLGTCDSSEVCRARGDGKNVCNLSTKRCEECVLPTDCGKGANRCDPETFTCSCGVTSDGGTRPPCDPTSNTPVCVGNACVQCAFSEDCTTARPHCDSSSNTCYACNQSNNPYPCRPGFQCSSSGTEDDVCTPISCTSDDVCPPGRTCDRTNSQCTAGVDLFRYEADVSLADTLPPSTVLRRTNGVRGPTACARQCEEAGDVCMAFDWRPDDTNNGEDGVCTLYTGEPAEIKDISTSTFLGGWSGRRAQSPATSCPIDPPTNRICLISPNDAVVYPHTCVISSNDNPLSRSDTFTLEDCAQYCANSNSTRCTDPSPIPQSDDAVPSWASLTPSGVCRCYGPDKSAVIEACATSSDATSILSYCKQ